MNTTGSGIQWAMLLERVRRMRASRVSHLYRVLLVILFLASCGNFPLLTLPTVQAQSEGDPFAMLTEAGDSVTIQQGAEAQRFTPYQLPFPLLAGDVVRAGKDGRAWIICKNDRMISVATNRSLTVNHAECRRGISMPPGTFDAVRIWGGQPVSTEQGDILQMPPREKENDYGYIPVILYPRNMALLDPRPTIRWTAVNGASGYLVTVSGPEGEVIDGQETTATEFLYPDASPDLQSGASYFVQVSARTNATDPLRKSDVVSVMVLSQEQADQVIAFATTIEDQVLDKATRHYLLGGYYAAQDLSQAAIAEFEALVEARPSALVHQALGNLYLQIGLLRDAFPHYTTALELAQTAGDLPSQAAAHVGLGQAEYGWDHYDKALLHLEKALALYKEQGLESHITKLQAAIETLRRQLAMEGESQSTHSATSTKSFTATSSRVEQRIQADLVFAEAERLLDAEDRDAAIAKWLEAAVLYREFDRLREADAYLAIANACSPFPVGGDELPNLNEFLKAISQNPDQLLTDMECAREYYLLAFLAATDSYEELCAKGDCFPNLNIEQMAKADALYRRGLAAYEAGRYDDAISDLQDAASTYAAADYPPGQVRALVSLSNSYFEQDPFMGALNALIPLFKALDLVNDFPPGDATDVRYLEGLHAYEQGQLQEAIVIWTEIIPLYQEKGDDQQIAVTRTNLGSAYAQIGDYSQSLALYAQALPTFEELEDMENQAVVRHNWGGTLVFQGNYPRALERFELALSDWRAIGNRLGEAASLDGAGFVLTQLGRLEEANAYLILALEFQRQLNDRPGQADSLTNLGNLDIQRGHYAQAEDYFNQALAIWREEKNLAKEMQLLSNLAAAQTGAGKVDQALATYDEALRLANTVNDRLVQAHVLINRGNLYGNLGDAQTAIGHYYQALAIFEEYGNQAGVATASAQLGEAYLMAGDLRRAQTYLERALAEVEVTGQQIGIANAHYSLGAFWSFLSVVSPEIGKNSQEEAEKHLQAALIHWENLENKDGQTLTLNYLAFVYQQQGDYDKALVAQTRALELAAETGNRLLQVRATIGLGLIQVESDELDAARATFEEARTLTAAIHDVRGELLIFVGEGYAAIKEKDPVAALAAIQQAIDRLEQWHGLLTVPELKMTFLDKLADLYDVATFLAYQEGQPDLAFEYVEQSKARALLEQLANLRIQPSADLEPDLVSREARLQGEITRLFGELEKAQAQTPPDQVRLDDLGNQLEEQRRAYADLLLEIQSRDPTFYTWRHPSILNLTEIQLQFLAGKEITLVEYAVSPLGTLAWIIDGENVTTVALEVDEATLAQKVSYWHQLIVHRNGTVQTTNQELYDLLFAPLQPYVRHRRLIIVLHGPLHRLAFAALHDGERYLVEDYAISYLPDASSLQFLPLSHEAMAWDGGRDVEEQTLVLGNPDGSLPYSADEARVVADLYGVVPLLGDQATEQIVKQQATNYDLLHLAAHGVYQPLSPLFTRLELAADGEEDGLLEIHEIYNLNLKETDLVVLSACQSQEGTISNGDEVLALNRAFLHAGVPAVVASLWPVEDEVTAELMMAFHRGIQAGTEPALALQAAQQSILVNPATAHPYYWAAFGLTGNLGAKPAVPTPTTTSANETRPIATESPTIPPTDEANLAPTQTPTTSPIGETNPTPTQTPVDTTPSDGEGGFCGLPLALPLLIGSILVFSRTAKCEGSGGV